MIWHREVQPAPVSIIQTKTVFPTTSFPCIWRSTLQYQLWFCCVVSKKARGLALAILKGEKICFEFASFIRWCWSPRHSSLFSCSFCATPFGAWGRIGLLGDSTGTRWSPVVESWCWSHSAQRTRSAGGAPVRTLMICASLNQRHCGCLTRFSLAPSLRSGDIRSVLSWICVLAT